MILSFRTQFPWGEPTDFVRKIKEGIKIHTIREDNRGWYDPSNYGKPLDLCTGVRTKKFDRFYRTTFKLAYKIKLYPEVKKIYIAVIDTKHFYELESVDELARKDGFDSVEDFWRYFDKPFYGKLIYWEQTEFPWASPESIERGNKFIERIKNGTLQTRYKGDGDAT